MLQILTFAMKQVMVKIQELVSKRNLGISKYQNFVSLRAFDSGRTDKNGRAGARDGDAHSVLRMQPYVGPHKRVHIGNRGYQLADQGRHDGVRVIVQLWRIWDQNFSKKNEYNSMFLYACMCFPTKIFIADVPNWTVLLILLICIVFSNSTGTLLNESNVEYFPYSIQELTG